MVQTGRLRIQDDCVGMSDTTVLKDSETYPPDWLCASASCSTWWFLPYLRCVTRGFRFNLL